MNNLNMRFVVREKRSVYGNGKSPRRDIRTIKNGGSSQESNEDRSEKNGSNDNLLENRIKGPRRMNVREECLFYYGK